MSTFAKLLVAGIVMGLLFTLGCLLLYSARPTLTTEEQKYAREFYAIQSRDEKDFDTFADIVRQELSMLSTTQKTELITVSMALQKNYLDAQAISPPSRLGNIHGLWLQHLSAGAQAGEVMQKAIKDNNFNSTKKQITQILNSAPEGIVAEMEAELSKL